MVSRLMERCEQKNLSLMREAEAHKKPAEIPFNEKKSKGFPSRKAHTRFFLFAASFSGRWKAAANVPLTLIMNHLALHDNFISPTLSCNIFHVEMAKINQE